MNKPLLLIAALGVGAYALTRKKSESKGLKVSVKYDPKELEEKGFVFVCDNKNYTFIIKDVYKLKKFSNDTMSLILAEPKFSDPETLEFPAVFSEFMSYFSPTCHQVYIEMKIGTKNLAIGFYNAMKMVAGTLLENLYGSERVAAKVAYKPELELNIEEVSIYEEALEYYTKRIEPILVQYKDTFIITDDDLKKAENYIVL